MYILTIALREIRTMLRRPSFYAAVLLAPVIVGGILFALSVVGDEFNERATADFVTTLKQPAGYIDQAGIIQTVPGELEQLIRPFTDEAGAEAAVRSGIIGSYFVIAPDYLQTGRVVRVSRQATITSASGPDTRAVEAILRANLAGDVELAHRIDQPLDLDVTVVGAVAPAPSAATGPSMVTAGPSYLLALLLAFSIVNGGGWLMQAIMEEKENRTIEILLTSVQPWQLMAGKLLGLGTIALLQFAVWFAIVRGIFGSGLGDQLSVGAVAPGVWVWMAVFFGLGFLFFGSLMLTIGAVGASMRESGQITGFMTIPIFMPLWFGGLIVENPDSMLALILSLVPFTAPVTIMLRLGQGPVTLWQLLLSTALLSLAVFGSVLLAGRLFRSTTLLAGAKPTPRVVWRALRAGG